MKTYNLLILALVTLFTGTAVAEEFSMKEWTRPSDKALKEQLTPLQYKVT